ncbi:MULTISPECIES: hypothetical protein [unclassified Sporolactobacillus]|uniref:hypothetical protein n=1 Tax=unclassified Sporolactobacillus TaxID=2628533 RepID=UPI00236839D9|nr:hypothetical protein [Sporolactobacillus sp. CQH2019]MDD9150421.1 hypothetical protein [Sporolactobacillus sp. CQH2019]
MRITLNPHQVNMLVNMLHDRQDIAGRLYELFESVQSLQVAHIPIVLKNEQAVIVKDLLQKEIEGASSMAWYLYRRHGFDAWSIPAFEILDDFYSIWRLLRIAEETLQTPKKEGN